MLSFRKYTPTLLERITTTASDEKRSRYSRLDAEKMRQLVISEIMEILNHANMEHSLDTERYPYVASSAMNYGLPKRVTYVVQDEWQTAEQDIRTAILRFEPRVIPETLVVNILNGEQLQGSYATLLFELSALIHWSPEPLDLYVRGRYDIDSDHVVIK